MSVPWEQSEEARAAAGKRRRRRQRTALLLTTQFAVPLASALALRAAGTSVLAGVLQIFLPPLLTVACALLALRSSLYARGRARGATVVPGDDDGGGDGACM